MSFCVYSKAPCRKQSRTITHDTSEVRVDLFLRRYLYAFDDHSKHLYLFCLLLHASLQARKTSSSVLLPWFQNCFATKIHTASSLRVAQITECFHFLSPPVMIIILSSLYRRQPSRDGAFFLEWRSLRQRKRCCDLELRLKTWREAKANGKSEDPEQHSCKGIAVSIFFRNWGFFTTEWYVHQAAETKIVRFKKKNSLVKPQRKSEFWR